MDNRQIKETKNTMKRGNITQLMLSFPGYSYKEIFLCYTLEVFVPVWKLYSPNHCKIDKSIKLKIQHVKRTQLVLSFTRHYATKNNNIINIIMLHTCQGKRCLFSWRDLFLVESFSCGSTCSINLPLATNHPRMVRIAEGRNVTINPPTWFVLIPEIINLM